MLLKNSGTLSHEERQDKMLNGHIPSVIIEMAIPTIIAFLITSIYNLADTFFVSSIGTNATAAVSVNSSLDQAIMMAGSMLAIGANSCIARLLGAGKKEKASIVLSTAFFGAIFLGALVLIFGSAFIHPLVRLLGATPTCEDYSVQYATYVLLVAPLMASNFVTNQCLRAEGAAMRSMIGMGFGGVLNCFLDPLFIFGLNLGVAGASMATAISKIASFAILVYPYLSHKSMLTLSPRMFRFDGKIIWEICSIGSSSLFRTLLGVVSAIVLNNLAGDISDAVLAGIGVSTKVMMFPFSIILGFSTGYQPVAGFNWGAKRYDRVRTCYSFAWKVALFGAVAMALVIALAAEPIISAFSGTDPEMQQVGALCIRLQCIALPIHSWVAIVNGYCAALGFPLYAVLLSTARQGTCFMPIVFPLASFFGATGIASVQALADVLTLFLAVPIIIKMLKIVNRAQAEQVQHSAEVTA